jgi:ribonuclease D
MTLNSYQLDPPQFINTQSGFDSAITHLGSEKCLAVDTEANSLFAYQEQVCLIQISTKGADYIIDTLALKDFSPLGEIFQDPTIEKIFHASEYDILIMHDDFGFKFRNLFDTMLAAQILGKKKLGLDALLEEFVGIKVNKKYQRANWGKRPLQDDMLKYAQVDTHYLFQIRDLLWEELKTRGLSVMAEEDFKRACLAHRHEPVDKLATFWRIRGAKKLSPQKAAILLKLCNYRDEVARKIDQPVFKVLGAQSLLRLAELSPTSVSQLLALDLVGKKALHRHAKGLVQAIQDGIKAPPEYLPPRERLDDSYLAREKALRDWRKQTAQQMNVNSAVVLPREVLYNLVAANPKTTSDLAEVLADLPWRLERFGEEILSILKEA